MSRPSAEREPMGTPEQGSAEAPERLDQRLDRLEAIVDALDSPDLELEDAMRLFEEGVTHLRHARELLRTTELRVDRLLDDGAGGARTQPIDDDS